MANKEIKKIKIGTETYDVVDESALHEGDLPQGEVDLTLTTHSISDSEGNGFDIDTKANVSHTHGNITNAGAIGSTSGNAVYTAANGVLTAGSLATSSPSASGSATAFIDTISQDAKGKITVTKKNVSFPTDNNQTVKGNGTAFGANDAIDIVAGSNVTVTPDTTNKKITIAATDTKPNNGYITFKINDAEQVKFYADDSTTNKVFNVTADSLGLSQAMKFIGVSTTDPAGTNGATVSGHTTWKKGEFVLYKRSGETYYEEYINITGSNTSTTTPNPNWELLGDDSTYAHKGVATSGATPATDSQGGHTHSVTINTYTATGATTVTGVSGSTTASKATAGTARKIGNANVGTAIACDDITAWTTNTPTSASVSGTCLVINTGSAASLSYTARSIAPATTSSDTITPYTFADVTVPKAATSATNVIGGISAGTASATTDSKGAHTHTVNSHTHTQQ